MSSRILVAGIGNIFFGDDAFGVEVAQRLSRKKLPPNVRVMDIGIRSFDLVYALLEGYDLAILIDTVKRGNRPGTLYVIEPDVNPSENGDGGIDTHGMVPHRVLELAQRAGGKTSCIRLIGCEPGSLELNDETNPGLSADVEAAVPEAIAMALSLIGETGTGQGYA